MPSKERAELIEEVKELILDGNLYAWTLQETSERILSTILAALQEPTEGMIEAGCDQYDFGDQITQGEILAKEWRAMLAASPLSEER